MATHTIATVKEIKSPIMGRRLGFRLIAARPNRGRFDPKEGIYKTSFLPQFQIVIQGDFKREPTMESRARFEQVLKRFPYNFAKVIWE